MKAYLPAQAMRFGTMTRESMTCRARELANCELLVVLGGPIGAYEEEKYPFLKDEIAVIEKRLNFGRPALGICLGAQLFARALGSRVYAGPGKEIGWAPITLTSAGKHSPLRFLEGVPVLALAWRYF